jgi:tyrosine-protein kinase Etk/Wzc
VSDLSVSRSISPAGRAVLSLASGLIWILLAAVVGAVLGYVYSKASVPQYRSLARLLPPAVSQNVASNLMTAVGGSGDLAASAAGLKNPAELYVGIMRSRSVLLPVIQKFDLIKHYGDSDIDSTERRFNQNLYTTVGKDGIIAVEVVDKDSQLAAQLCNEIINSMYDSSRRLAADERERRERFYAPWLHDAHVQLTAAEDALKAAESRTGLTRVKGQEESNVYAAAELRAQITNMTATLRAMEQYAAPGNPELQRGKAQLASMQARLAGMERRFDQQPPPALQMPLSEAVASSDSVGRLRREVRLRENLLELIAKISEVSKVDENKDLSLIKVLDAAVPTARPVTPRTSVNTVLGALLGISVVTAYILFRHHLRTRRGGSSFWPELKRAVLRRR